jgi:hypothetical protein
LRLDKRLKSLNATVAPNSRRFWLSLRAEIMELCEGHGIKKTTCSVELGKWQTEIGYDMKRVGP